jgi:hypothetical protein
MSDEGIAALEAICRSALGTESALERLARVPFMPAASWQAGDCLLVEVFYS